MYHEGNLHKLQNLRGYEIHKKFIQFLLPNKTIAILTFDTFSC